MDSPSGGGRRKARVLVINDDQIERNTIESRLRRASVQRICVPNSPRELLKLLAGEIPGGPLHFELIILDYVFAGWGTNLAAVHSALKESAITKDSTIVVLTAFKVGEGGADKNTLLKQLRYPIYDYQGSDQSTIDDIVASYID